MINEDWLQSSLEIGGKSSFLDHSGTKIHYVTWGDSSNPVLFFVHGYAANTHWWDFIAPHFVEDFYVVAVDLSGMGDSEQREFYSQDLYSDEILEICKELSINSINLVAHSMGGPISLNFADQNPDLISRLILIDSIIVMPPDKIRSGRSSMLRHDFYYDSLEEAIDQFRLIPPQPCKNEILVRHIAKHSYVKLDEGYALKSDGMIMRTYQHKDLTDALTNLNYPIYLVYGLMSQIFSQDILDFTAYVANLSEDKIIGIPGGMHHLFIDEPLLFIEKLKNILV